MIQRLLLCGFHASLREEAIAPGVTHGVFNRVADGFAAVPVEVMRDYFAEAGFAPKSVGTVRHDHVSISTDARPESFHHGHGTRRPLEQDDTKLD